MPKFRKKPVIAESKIRIGLVMPLSTLRKSIDAAMKAEKGRVRK